MGQCNLCKLDQMKRELLTSTSKKTLTIIDKPSGRIEVYKHPADIEIEPLTNRQRYKYWAVTFERLPDKCCC